MAIKTFTGGCNVELVKPKALWSQREKARGWADPLACNRPSGHAGEHQHLDHTARVLSREEANGRTD